MSQRAARPNVPYRLPAATDGSRALLGLLTRRIVFVFTLCCVAFLATWALTAVSAEAAAAVAPSSSVDAPLPGPSLEQRRAAPQTTVDEVSRTVMCPSCDTTLDQSNAPAAERMRTYVEAAVAAGWTPSEIRLGLIAQYDGDESILAEPTRSGLGLVAWLVPGILAAAALAMGATSLRRWRRENAASTDQARSTESS